MEKDGIYKCSLCGNVVEAIEEYAGVLVCCGKEMDLQKSKSEDEGQEKHVPILKIEGNNVKVAVGSIPHPMEEGHYIELIELLGDGEVLATYRPKPGEKPEAEWCISLDKHPDAKITAREYCNLHGLWETK